MRHTELSGIRTYAVDVDQRDVLGLPLRGSRVGQWILGDWAHLDGIILELAHVLSSSGSLVTNTTTTTTTW